MNLLSRLLARAAVLAAALCQLPALAGVTTLIPAATHADIAFDTTSHIVYISGSDSLQRFDLDTQSFLDPLFLGGRTYGMDISPDGHFLAVANTARGATKNFVDLIDLRSGQQRRIGFDLAFGEGGTFTTAFDGSGGLLVSSTYEGSGWSPLRRYDLNSGSVVTLGSVRQNSMLTASADRSVVAIAESNSSNGPWGLYRSGATSYASNHSTGWFNYEIGVSRNGRQVAVPTYGGTFIDDATTIIPTIGEYAAGQPIGVAYHPGADLVFFPWAGSSMVYEYDAANGRRLTGFDFEESFSTNGNFAFGSGRSKVAADGSFLFVTTNSGVRFMALAPVPEPSAAALASLGLAGLGLWISRQRRVASRPS